MFGTLCEEMEAAGSVNVFKSTPQHPCLLHLHFSSHHSCGPDCCYVRGTIHFSQSCIKQYHQWRCVRSSSDSNEPRFRRTFLWVLCPVDVLTMHGRCVAPLVAMLSTLSNKFFLFIASHTVQHSSTAQSFQNSNSRNQCENESLPERTPTHKQLAKVFDRSCFCNQTIYLFLHCPRIAHSATFACVEISTA